MLLSKFVVTIHVQLRMIFHRGWVFRDPVGVGADTEQGNPSEQLVGELGPQGDGDEISETELDEAKCVEDAELFREFTAGGIHDDLFRSFWKDELKASNWVLDVLKTGYIIP